jgi:ADP-ribose pyrophosphatase YjhB (NUDIX family)
MRGREYPERPLLAAAAVIMRGDEVVLVRRSRAPRLGEWSIPGGAVELGESLRQAAEREALEETALTVEASEILEVFESITPDAAGKINFHYVIVDFLCRLRSGELRAGGDASEAQWFTRSELNRLNLAESTLRVLSKGFELKAKS